MPRVPGQVATYGHRDPILADPLIPFAEWCANRRISIWTGRRIVANGDLRVVRISPRRWMVRQSEAARYDAAREVAA
jgi:predicted site-specific integrase-resolvase